MAFIVGSGPSLHFTNVDLMKDYVTFGVNSAFLKIKDFADYFVSSDQGMKWWSYYLFDLKESDCVKLLYEKKLAKEAYHLNNVLFYDCKWYWSPSDKSLNLDGLKLTKNAYKKIIGNRTSSGAAVHFAFIVGADPIVLISHDNCYKDGNRYWFQYPDEPKPYRVNGVPLFADSNRGRHPRTGDYWDSHCAQIAEYWHLLSIQTKKQGINIINASRHTVLDCFPRMTLDEVLEKYGDRKKPKKESLERKE